MCVYSLLYLIHTFLRKSISSVRKVVKESVTSNGIFSTHRKNWKKELDDFDQCANRQKVHFYSVKKQYL